MGARRGAVLGGVGGALATEVASQALVEGVHAEVEVLGFDHLDGEVAVFKGDDDVGGDVG